MGPPTSSPAAGCRDSGHWLTPSHVQAPAQPLPAGASARPSARPSTEHGLGQVLGTAVRTGPPEGAARSRSVWPTGGLVCHLPAAVLRRRAQVGQLSAASALCGPAGRVGQRGLLAPAAQPSTHSRASPGCKTHATHMPLGPWTLGLSGFPLLGRPADRKRTRKRGLSPPQGITALPG